MLVPNVVRSADDFIAGNSDMFFFTFGGPKVREADATVGGVRPLEMDANGMPAARKIMPWGYLTDISPGPFYTGVDKPMKVYSFDNVLITNAKVSDDFVYKLLDAMEKGKGDIVARRAGDGGILSSLRLQAIWRALSSGRAEVFQGA